MTTFCVTVLCTATRFSGDKGEACRYDLSAIGGERPRHISVSVFHVQVQRRQDILVRGYTKRQTKIYISLPVFHVQVQRRQAHTWLYEAKEHDIYLCQCFTCRSNDDRDEMCEAGAWLYKATGDEQFLVEAKHEHQSTLPGEYSWSD